MQSATALVLGGARSGKSTWAEQSLTDFAEVDYVATGYPDLDDGEWQQRLALHRARRPASWHTIETLDLASVLLAKDTDRPVLIDCLTVWLTREMDEVGAWTNDGGWEIELKKRTSELADAFRDTDRMVIAVSNEVGQGLVPADPGSRTFRDQMGMLNSLIASVVDEVWFCIAGIPTKLK